MADQTPGSECVLHLDMAAPESLLCLEVLIDELNGEYNDDGEVSIWIKKFKEIVWELHELIRECTNKVRLFQHLIDPFRMDDRPFQHLLIDKIQNCLHIADRFGVAKIPTSVKQVNSTGNRFFMYDDDDILFTEVALDWDGKMTSKLQDKSTRNRYGVHSVQHNNFSHCPNKYGDHSTGHSNFSHPNLKVTPSQSCKITIRTRLQDKSNGLEEEVELPFFSLDKRKETVQRVSSFVSSAIVLLWIIFDICTHSSIIQLQPFHKQNGPAFIWSSLLEPFGFVVFVWAIAAMIVVGAPFSRMQSAMLMFWAILMLVRSAKSITQVYLPILGILFTGWYMLPEKLRLPEVQDTDSLQSQQ